MAPSAPADSGLGGTNIGRVRTRRPISTARGWLRSGGAILIVFAAAGCSTTVEPSVAASATTASLPPSVTPASPAQLLAAALAPLLAANQFETTITIDGKAAITSVGRSVSDSTQLTVTTSGKAVEYVRIPPQAWARPEGGTWVLITVDEAPGSPIGVLAAPTTLAPDAADPTHLVATYPAASLGLEGDPVTVTITLGAAVTFRYEVDAGGHPTISETTIRPTTSTEPITAPI